MSALGSFGRGCGGCGSCAHAARRRPYYGAQPYRGGTEYMVAPAAQPQFGERMSFAAALAHPDANSIGLYRIYKKAIHIYSGRAVPGTIRARLLAHRLCLTQMAVDPALYTVSFAPMRRSSPAHVIANEKDEIRTQRNRPGSRTTNRREGEAMFGLLWPPPHGAEAMAGSGQGSKRRVQRQRSGSGRTTRPAPAPASALSGNCDQLRDNCMAASRQRPGRVWGESRCLSCYNTCRMAGGWPTRIGRVRCDYWS